jgi:hypothetical protein
MGWSAGIILRLPLAGELVERRRYENFFAAQSFSWMSSTRIFEAGKNELHSGRNRNRTTYAFGLSPIYHMPYQ